MNDDVTAAAVDGSDHPFAADGFRQRARKDQIRPPGLEQRRTGDDFTRAGREHLVRALDGTDAAANAACQRPGDLPNQRQVVAAAHRRVEIDHLDLRKSLEPSYPMKHIAVLEREPFALHELDDGAVSQINRGDQHNQRPTFFFSRYAALNASTNRASTRPGALP